MIFTETLLKGAYIIDVERLEDDRGFFGRSFCKNEFEKYGLNNNIVQSNISFNTKKATLRGMHMQAAPNGEEKLIRCTRGAIYDVIIDMRKNSTTFGKWFGIELTADNYKMLYIPKEFAHGFITLEDNTETSYQMTEYFTPGASKGYRWNDPAFGIQWPITPKIISEKDRMFPLLGTLPVEAR